MSAKRTAEELNALAWWRALHPNQPASIETWRENGCVSDVLCVTRKPGDRTWRRHSDRFIETIDVLLEDYREALAAVVNAEVV